MLFKRPSRKPDLTIGSEENPYLRRWYVIPSNRFFNIYLHEFLRSDDDRALHDHPWWNLSIVLSGGYIEIVPDRKNPKGTDNKIRLPGSIVFRPAKARHRIVVYKPAWTLFLTGPRFREWGFHCPQGWVHWKKFTAGPNGETVGKGCDQ